jgi:hypothetical protein
VKTFDDYHTGRNTKSDVKLSRVNGFLKSFTRRHVPCKTTERVTSPFQRSFVNKTYEMNTASYNYWTHDNLVDNCLSGSNQTTLYCLVTTIITQEYCDVRGLCALSGRGRCLAQDASRSLSRRHKSFSRAPLETRATTHISLSWQAGNPHGTGQCSSYRRK